MLLVPLSDQTRGMIGDEQLARMKRTATLVNVARGPVVDTAALLRALETKTIAGAALDVTDPEPLPAEPSNDGVGCVDDGRDETCDGVS